MHKAAAGGGVAATGTNDRAVEDRAARYLVLERLLERGADQSIAAAGTQGRPVDAAKGLHQGRKDRRVWPEAVALLEAAIPREGEHVDQALSRAHDMTSPDEGVVARLERELAAARAEVARSA